VDVHHASQGQCASAATLSSKCNVLAEHATLASDARARATNMKIRRLVAIILPPMRIPQQSWR